MANNKARNFGKKQAVVEMSDEDKALVADFRSAIKDQTEHVLLLSDADCLAIINANTSDDDDGGITAMNAALEKDDSYDGELIDADANDDADTVVSISATKLDPDAVRLADKLAANANVLADLNEWVEIESKRKRLPANIAYHFSTTLTKDEILGAPVPGSSYKDKEKDASLRNTKIDVRKPGEDGGGSFYTDVAIAFKEGRMMRNQLIALNKALSDTETTPAEYSGKSTNWKIAEKKMITDRFNALKSAIKSAMKICQRIHAIKDETLLLATFRTETADGVTAVVRGHTPLQVYYLKDDPNTGAKSTQDRWVAVSTFNRVDLAKIGKLTTAAEQLDAFIVKKGKKKTGVETGSATPLVVTSGPDLAEVMYDLKGRFEDKKFLASVYGHIATDEGGEFLDCLFAVEEKLHRITMKPEMKAKVLAYREQASAAEQKEQDQKDKKAA